MPEFETYVDVDVDEYWNICSKREKDELIDLIEDEGWVKRTVKKGEKPSSPTSSDDALINKYVPSEKK
jgi:hypothetical protein